MRSSSLQLGHFLDSLSLLFGQLSQRPETNLDLCARLTDALHSVHLLYLGSSAKRLHHEFEHLLAVV